MEPPADARPRIPEQRAAPAPGQLLITGDVGDDLVLDTAELDARATVQRQVHYRTRRCDQVHLVRGVPLHEVLVEAAPRLDGRHKMGLLNVVVLATSEDGFQVVLSLAEVDPEFGACSALLATRYNGRTLARPTLVMPSDGRASRYVRQVCRVRLQNMAPADDLVPAHAADRRS
ncbi:molybdopterin-binding protein [Saccharopolyspora sp. NPDC047091]|uniref:molybdopterin-binding protein n=1 Tax=Saccharopolyspora sp. NPDC047091 TaxID=3155924 RepID=UPI0033FFF542